jgi:hypothetical protein
MYQLDRLAEDITAIVGDVVDAAYGLRAAVAKLRTAISYCPDDLRRPMLAELDNVEKAQTRWGTALVDYWSKPEAAEDAHPELTGAIFNLVSEPTFERAETLATLILRHGGAAR